MKELSIQEKAQFYDEAIERANELLYVSDNESLQYKTIKHILPNLKSSNKRIRQALIRFHKCTIDIDGIKGDEIIDWLEKQDEQKPNPYSGTSFEYNGHTWCMCARDNGVKILIDGNLKGIVFTDDSKAKEIFIEALERVEEQSAKGYKLTDFDKNSWWEDFKAYSCYSEQILDDSAKTCNNEQMTSDNVEPKFKVGDWVVNKFGDSWHIDILDKKNYRVSDGKGNYNYFPISKQDEMHIWTVQDAKDGDVLSYKNNQMVQVGIIEKYVGKHGGCSNTFKIYIGVNWDNILQMGNYMGCSNIHPATKEQRDFLMKEINDAGYEWDTEKKELRRIDQSKLTEVDY